MAHLSEHDASGLAIEASGRTIRLKWHRLRRRLSDPLFSAEAAALGLLIGASMELDLRIRADGGFAVLHNARIDRETTGTGPVAAMTRADFAGCFYADGKRPVLMSEDLAAMLAGAHREAVLQFDMKDDFAAIGDRGVAHLAQHFAATPGHLMISGASTKLIAEIRRHLPSVRRGIDPTDDLVAVYAASGKDAVRERLIAHIRSGTAPGIVYLEWRLILRAAREGLDLIGLSHDHGIEVDAWTFNPARPDAGFSNSEMQRLSEIVGLAPDQITTDEPLALERAWRAGGAIQGLIP